MANIYSNYFITQAAGGWSPCIEGNNAYGLRPFPGSVLPNCVGYVVGDWNEMLNAGPSMPWLGSVDAKYLYGLAIAQGCSTGQNPQVGALMVWSDPNDEGHAAVVKTVYDNDNVTATESGWNYTTAPIVRNITRTRGANGLWGETKTDRTFLGFVYLPGTPQPSGDSTNGWYMFFHEGD